LVKFAKVKKNWLPAIVILMIVSLTGIVFVQYFWIREAIRVKEEQFDRSVNNSLVQVTKRIENDVDLRYISERLTSGPGSYSYIYSTSDSIETNQIIWKEKSDKNINWSGSGKGGSIIINNNDREESYNIRIENFADEDKRESTIIQLDSLKETFNEEEVVVISRIRDSVNLIVERKIKDYDRRKQNLEGILNELVFEIKTLDEPIDQKLEGVNIQERLSQSLDNSGISAEYEFAVYFPNIDSVTPIRSSKFNRRTSSEIYSAQLLPGQVLDNPTQLMVYFPGKTGIILSSMAWLLSGSFLFTLIIILTFYITLHTILRQKKLSEIKSDFINNMTHEFKTPIATISLAVDSINNPAVISDSDKIKYFTNVIREENTRMNHRVESVLQMSLIDKSDFNLKPEPMDVHDLIRGAVKNFGLQLTEKSGKIDLLLNADNPMINGDKEHLYNIICNLIDNAVKYNETEPVIEISTEIRGNNFYIRVKDNGIGMTKEEEEKIFDRFYRVSSGDIHNVKGFGLGLSYVKAILLSMGGEIKVSSQPGKGSTFTLSLPVIR
jgi:two-component system phosphate regulon sensor histidine kinase PhoR